MAISDWRRIRGFPGAGRFLTVLDHPLPTMRESEQEPDDDSTTENEGSRAQNAVEFVFDLFELVAGLF